MKYLFAFLIVSLLGAHISLAQQRINTEIEITSIANEQFKHRVADNIEATLGALQEAYNSNIQPKFDQNRISPEGQEAILELWGVDPFRCIYPRIPGPLVRRPKENRFEFRGVMMHLENELGRLYTKEGFFVLDKSGKIVDFKFGLDVHQSVELLERKEFISNLEHRYFILDFLDDFRNAYTRKDINFLEEVFSENALIIVGRVVERSSNNDVADQVLGQFESEEVELIVRDKAEYLSSLKDVFNRNEKIEVKFDSISIYTHGTVDNIYGVQLVQDWKASGGYSDQGYIFLMIDLRNLDKPMIHVRTWQPLEETSIERRIGIDDIHLIKD